MGSMIEAQGDRYVEDLLTSISTTGPTYFHCMSAGSALLGWLSRPNDDHRGWRDVYAVFKENRHTHSSLFLFDGVFEVDPFDELVLSLHPFDETTLFHMLKKDFHPINASHINSMLGK